MEWKFSPGLVDYDEALAQMNARVAAIQAREADELVWLLEHPPLYTAGSSAKTADLLGAQGLPVYQTGRGGQYTYHGPGQRVAYVMRDLKKHAGAKGPDLRAYVKQLEAWLIETLAEFGIDGFIREGRVGVWVKEGVARYPLPVIRKNNGSSDHRTIGSSDHRIIGSSDHRIIGSSEKKIAALGVRVQKWVTSHGVALNVNPDLSHYAGIVPCGIREFGVTSMHALGVPARMAEVDDALKRQFSMVFG